MPPLYYTRQFYVLNHPINVIISGAHILVNVSISLFIPSIQLLPDKHKNRIDMIGRLHNCINPTCARAYAVLVYARTLFTEILWRTDDTSYVFTINNSPTTNTIVYLFHNVNYTHFHTHDTCNKLYFLL